MPPHVPILFTWASFCNVIRCFYGPFFSPQRDEWESIPSPFSVKWISSDSINLLTDECFMETIWVSGNLDQNSRFLDKMLCTSWLACATGNLLVVWYPCSKVPYKQGSWSCLCTEYSESLSTVRTLRTSRLFVQQHGKGAKKFLKSKYPELLLV